MRSPFPTSLVTVPIPSPCVGVCKLDAAVPVCVGCGRTLDEIARWGQMSDAERKNVMERLTRSSGTTTEFPPCVG